MAAAVVVLDFRDSTTHRQCQSVASHFSYFSKFQDSIWSKLNSPFWLLIQKCQVIPCTPIFDLSKFQFSIWYNQPFFKYLFSFIINHIVYYIFQCEKSIEKCLVEFADYLHNGKKMLSDNVYI